MRTVVIYLPHDLSQDGDSTPTLHLREWVTVTTSLLLDPL